MSVIRRHLAGALLMFATVTLSGCGDINRDSIDTESIEAEIRQADSDLLRAETHRDLEGAMSFIAPHAVFHPPEHAPIVGHEAIRDFYENEWFKLPFVEMTGMPESVFVGPSGDMAYFDGRSEMVVEVSGERTVAEGKYLGVWQQISGQWKLVAISWSANGATR